MAVPARLKLASFLLGAGVIGVAAFACGTTAGPASEFTDTTVDATLAVTDAGGAMEPDVLGLPCTDDNDCLGGAGNCGYRIAESCGATGTCIPKLNGGPGCLVEACGCDGSVVYEPCYWYGDGAYATAPVDPDGYCAIRLPPPDASAEAADGADGSDGAVP